MKTSNGQYRSQYTTSIAETNLRQLAETLVKLFERCKSRIIELSKSKEQTEQLDSQNPDYVQIYNDRRERNKMNWLVAVVPMCFGVDYLLSLQPLSILADEWGLSPILKILVPIFLIGSEIIISYFQIQRQRNGEAGPWLVRNTQYFVILLLVALSAIVVVYSVQAYSKDTNIVDFLYFIIGIIIFQTVLLLVSIMLHLWLIRHSENIAEAFAFLGYKNEKTKLSNKIKKIEGENSKIYLPEFATRVHSFIRNNETFKRQYPDIEINFSETLPIDLILAINKIMGRDYFSPPSENASKNHMYEQDTSR